MRPSILLHTCLQHLQRQGHATRLMHQLETVLMDAGLQQMAVIVDPGVSCPAVGNIPWSWHVACTGTCASYGSTAQLRPCMLMHPIQCGGLSLSLCNGSSQQGQHALFTFLQLLIHCCLPPSECKLGCHLENVNLPACLLCLFVSKPCRCCRAPCRPRMPVPAAVVCLMLAALSAGWGGWATGMQVLSR